MHLYPYLCIYTHIYASMLISSQELTDTVWVCFYQTRLVCFVVTQYKCVIMNCAWIMWVRCCAPASVIMLICVCHDLSGGNSCSGVGVIIGWVLWEEVPTISPSLHPLTTTHARAHTRPHTHTHTHTSPLSLSAILQGSLQMTECFCPAFEIFVTFLSDAQPNNKGAFMLWSRLGKGIDKTSVGKDLSLSQVVHAVDYQKDCKFV